MTRIYANGQLEGLWLRWWSGRSLTPPSDLHNPVNKIAFFIFWVFLFFFLLLLNLKRRGVRDLNNDQRNQNVNPSFFSAMWILFVYSWFIIYIKLLLYTHLSCLTCLFYMRGFFSSGFSGIMWTPCPRETSELDTDTPLHVLICLPSSKKNIKVKTPPRSQGDKSQIYRCRRAEERAWMWVWNKQSCIMTPSPERSRPPVCSPERHHHYSALAAASRKVPDLFGRNSFRIISNDKHHATHQQNNNYRTLINVVDVFSGFFSKPAPWRG